MSFTQNAISNMVGFKYILLLFVFYLSHLSFASFFSVSYFLKLKKKLVFYFINEIDLLIYLFFLWQLPYISQHIPFSYCHLPSNNFLTLPTYFEDLTTVCSYFFSPQTNTLLSYIFSSACYKPLHTWLFSLANYLLKRF